MKRCKNLVNESQSIRLYLHESGSLLTVKDINDKRLNLYFEPRDHQSSDYSGDVLNLTGIVNDDPHLNIKEDMSFSVKKLDIRL